MKVYEFAASRQFIFHKEIGGVQRLIEFGELSGGTSAFQTKDAKVAEAIRGMQLFKRGAIVETTRGGNEPEEKGVEEKGVEEKVFTNITRAKEWMSKTWGIPRGALRKPSDMEKAAKEHGVKVVIEALEG